MRILLYFITCVCLSIRNEYQEYFLGVNTAST